MFKRQKKHHGHDRKQKRALAPLLKLNPFDDVPSEILLIIFEYAIASCTSSDDLKLQPHHFARVCHTWRTVMLDSTAVWMNIVFSLHKPIDFLDPSYINQPDFVHNKSGVKLAKLALTRSGTRPLRVIVSPSSDTDLRRRGMHETARLAKFVALITPYLPRIESLQITLADSALASELAYELASWSSAPKLKELLLACTDPYGIATMKHWPLNVMLSPRPGPRSFNDMPMLRSATLSVPNFLSLDILDTFQGIEMLNLTHYSYFKQSAYDPLVLLRRLQHLPHLKHLEISGILGDADPVGPPTIAVAPEDPTLCFTLPALESLIIQRLCGPYIKLFFEHSRAPALRSLTVGHTEYSLLIIDAFRSIAGSDRFPVLTEFHIHDTCYLLFQEIVLYLTWVEKMSMLHLRQCYCRRKHTWNYADQPLEPSLEEPWPERDLGPRYLCPKLADLTIELHGFRHCRSLRAMLRGRLRHHERRMAWKPPQPVKKLTVANCACHEPLSDYYHESFIRWGCTVTVI